MGWTSVATAGIILTCLALFLQIVAFAIPFWFSHVYTLTTATKEKDLGLYMNVWYAMSCYPGDTGSCESAAIKPNFNGSTIDGLKVIGVDPDTLSASAVVLFGLSPHWRVIQIITTVSVGLNLLAGLVMICSRCMGSHSQGAFLITIICLILSGITAIGIASFNAYANAKLLDFIVTDYLTWNTFPYSILIFGIGGVISLFAALVLMMVIHKWERYGAYREDDDTSAFEDDVPMSKVNSSRERGMDNPRYGYDQPRRDYSSYDRSRNGYSDRSRYDDGYRRDYDQGSSRANQDYYGESRRDYREKDNYYGQSRKEDMYRPYNNHRY